MTTTILRCKKCGATPPANAKFCTECGNALYQEIIIPEIHLPDDNGQSNATNLSHNPSLRIKLDDSLLGDYFLRGSTLTIPAYADNITLKVDEILEKHSNITIDTLVFEEGIENIITSFTFNYEILKSIHTIVFPKSLTSIGGEVFKGYTGIESIYLPENLKSLGYKAFEGCVSLKTITFPDTLTSIGNECFIRCTALEKVNLPSSLTFLGKYAFSNCSSITSIDLPKSLVRIEDGTFNDCINLKQIVIPEGISSIGEFAFNSTSLRTIELPSSLRTIGDCAFGIVPEVHVSIPSDAPVYTSHAFFNMEDMPDYSVVGSGRATTGFKRKKRVGRLIAFWIVIALCALLNVTLLFDLGVIAIIAAAIYKKKESLPWRLFSKELWNYLWTMVFYKKP